jgi:GntR family transcriptional regulator, rspAB operon transcriptional repressor
MAAKVTKLETGRLARARGTRRLSADRDEAIVRPSLRQQAYESLRDAILRLDLKPGSVTTDSELSRKLNMSRTPVREAVTLLERDHLVTRIPNQGVLIRELSMNDIVHVLQMREAMDGLAARLAAASIDLAALAALEGEFKAMHELSTTAASKVHASLSRRLHNMILETAGNPFLTVTSRELGSLFDRTRNYNWHVWGTSKNAERIAQRRYGEHIEIIAALKARDPRRAEKAARAHIVSALDDVLKSMIGGR